MGMRQESLEGILPPYARQLLSFVGIFLLGILALTAGAGRPYVSRVNPAAHTSKAATVAEVRDEIAAQVQPTE